MKYIITNPWYFLDLRSNVKDNTNTIDLQIYFGFQQLSIPVFDKKDQIDSLAEKVGVKTGFLFAPNDCNCCS